MNYEVIVKNSDSMRYKEVTIKYDQTTVFLGLINQEEANELAQTFIKAADNLLDNIEISQNIKEELGNLFNILN